MPPVNPSQAKTLADIQGTLKNLSAGLSSMSPTEKAKFESSKQSDGIKDVLGSTTNYAKTLKNVNGVITSTSARNAVEKGKEVIGGDSQSAFSKMMSDFQNLTKNFEQEQERRKSLEADLSIAEKRKQQAVDEAITQTKDKRQPDPMTTDTKSDGTNGEVAANSEPLVGLENDPVGLALTQAMNEKVNLTNSQLKQLSAMFEGEDEDTRRTIKNAESLAQVQTERIQKENERLAQAARVAGVVAGRGMYSPYEHEGIISEVVQEGLARVQEIEYTKQETIITAKKALRDFKYKTFTEATKLINDLSDMKRQTVIDMNARLVEIERMEREKINFDNEQADRNAILLAPELVNADRDTLISAAAQNNIPLGALTKAVADYKYEQQNRELTLTEKRESILSSRDARNRANQKDVPEPEKPLTLAEIKTIGEINPKIEGKVPAGWTRTDYNTFDQMYGDAPKEDIPALIQKFNKFQPIMSMPAGSERDAAIAAATTVKESEVENIVSDVISRVKADAKTFKPAADAAGSSSAWKGKGKDVENWVKEKARQDRIKAWAEEGYEAYQIVEMLKP